MDYNSRGSRRARRLALMKANGDVLISLHARWMVLSAYMCCSWWAAALSSMALWLASFARSHDKLVTTLHAPLKLIQWWFPPWPPDGILTHVIMFFVVLSCQLFVSCELLRRGFALVAKSHSYSKVVSSRLLQRSLELFATPFLSRFVRFKMIREMSLPAVLATVLSSCEEDVKESTKNVTWDSDSVQVVVDNSATTHVWNVLDDFQPGTLYYFEPDDDVGVITVDKEESKPIGKGTVHAYLIDSRGIRRKLVLEDALYFPNSPVNVLGVTKLAETLDDYDGTWIKTMRNTSHFVWDHEQYELEFQHPNSNLPMVSMNKGFSKYSSFVTMFNPFTTDQPPTAMTTCKSCLPTDESTDIQFVSEKVTPGTSRAKFHLMHSV